AELCCRRNDALFLPALRDLAWVRPSFPSRERRSGRDRRRMLIAERLIDVNGVELCTESFGDPADPPIVLVMGIGASMLWWQDGFCGLLAGHGRFVIRSDQRATGRSTTYEPGRPGYNGGDLLADAVAVLDGYRLA